jgi:hypothetical protein
MTALSLIRATYPDAELHTDLSDIGDALWRTYELPLDLEELCGEYATDGDILRWHSVADVERWLDARSVAV